MLKNRCSGARVDDMSREEIIAKLREHESELRAAGVEHLFLHGSYARGTAIAELSDVDVIAESIPTVVCPFSIWLALRIGLPIFWVFGLICLRPAN